MIDDPFTVVVIACELLILCVAMGAVAGALWILPAGGSAASKQDVLQLRHRLGTLLGPCLIALTFTSLAGLLLRTASMSELPVWSVFPVLGTVLVKTHFGQLWLWRAAALLALWILWALQRRHPSARSLSAGGFIALAIIIFTLSGSGHPGDDGLLSLTNLANTLHIIGAFLWGGGIIAMMVIILPALLRSRAAARELIALTSLRLSTLASIALALVLVPGLYNAWLLVGSWRGLWENLYGQLLLAKIALAGIMAALGAFNRYVYVPAIQRHAGLPEPRILLPLPRFMHTHNDADSPTHFLRNLYVEAALLIGILALAAALSQQTPAAHAEHEMAEHADPASLSESPNRRCDQLASVEQLHPMPHLHRGAALQMQLTTDIGGDDEVGHAGLQCGEFIGEQLPGEFRLQERISAGRAAAQMSIGHGRQLIAAAAQQTFDHAIDLLPMLQSTWRMKRDFAAAAIDGQGFHFLRGENLAEVFGQATDVRRLDGIGGIVVQ